MTSKQANQIFNQYQLTDEKRRHIEMFYGAGVAQSQFPIHYATVEQIDAWLNDMRAVRQEFVLSDAQMRPFDHIGYPATIEQMRTFAEQKVGRVYQTNDELPAYANLVKKFEMGDSYWNGLSVYELKGRYYVTLHKRVLGNRGNRHAHGETGCYFTEQRHAVAAADKHAKLELS
jgi:hypothetical protein